MIDCEFCQLTVSKSNYSKHKKTDICKNINTIIKNNIKDNEIKLSDYIKQNDILKDENLSLNNKILTLEIKLKDALDKSEEYRKIVEKSATKTTVKNNYTHNNYLNYISSEPLKISEIPKQLKQYINCDTMMLDDNDFHEHIVDNILRDENGKDKVLCTDINRKNFSYKDEKSGELISDPELERLREQLKKGADIKYLKRDLLNKLVKEYEENGNIGIDPYKKFYDILLKIDFGIPFVEHVAKKTYIKCKSGNDMEIEN